MKVGEAIAEILKREGVEIIFGYPVNHVLEAAAVADIRTVIVRQERVGLHMADAMSRVDERAQDRRVLRCSTGRARKTPSAAWRRLTANPFRFW